MGRGKDGLLGPIKATHRETNKRSGNANKKSKASDILFRTTPIHNSNLYSSPESLALAQVKIIVRDIKKESFYSLIEAVDPNQPGSISDNPFFIEIARQSIEKDFTRLVQESGFPKKGKGLKQEKENALQELLDSIIRQSETVINSQDSLRDKEKHLRDIFTINHADILSLFLNGQGPIRDHTLANLRTRPLEKGVTRDQMAFLFQGDRTDEKEDIFAEMVRRQAFRLLHRAKPTNSWPPQKKYSTLKGSRQGAIIHLLNDRGRSLCADNEDVAFHKGYIPHGSWRDSKITGDMRQCSKCKKAADKDLLEQVEGEREDNQAAYFGSETQKLVEELARDTNIFSAAKRAFQRGADGPAMSAAICQALAPSLGEIMAISAEDEEGLLLYAGGGHIIWDDLDLDTVRRMESSGFKNPKNALELNWRYRMKADIQAPWQLPKGIKREEDPLLDLLSAEVRKSYSQKIISASLENDSKKRFDKEKEAKAMVNQALTKALDERGL